MKTSNSILGAIITFFLLIGIVFKIMHWPGAGPIIVLFSGLLSIYMIPVAIGNIMSYENKKFIGICNGVGAFAGMTLSMGLLFKIMHWPGGNSVMIMGFLLSIITFFIFLIYFITSKESIKLSSGTFYSVSSIGILLYGVSVGGSSFAVIRNTTLNAINIENNSRELFKINNTLSKEKLNTDVKTVFDATETLNDYINNLKIILYQNTDYLPQEVADTISLSQIMAKDNYDIPTYILGLGDPMNPKDGDYTAYDLKKQIEAFNAIAATFSNQEINLTNQTNMYGSYEETWETSMFYHYPLSQVILSLNQIQLEANIICNSILAKYTLQEINPLKE